MKKTVVFDFDGVIHSYTSGWQGEARISDPPVPGIQEALHRIHDAGYEVVVVSTRCKYIFGRMAIEDWLDMYGMTVFVDKVCKEKPPAIAYVDDRAICFDGHPETLLEKIEKFRPWNKSPETNADRIRSMRDEELAKLLLDGCCGSKCDDQTQNEWGSVNCFECRMKWLQQPAMIEKKG